MSNPRCKAGTGWDTDWSRRAFLARGGALATVAALGPLASATSTAAAATTDPVATALSAGRVGVATALASSVLAAAGPAAAAVAPQPADSAAALEAGFAGLAVTDQTAIDILLDAVNTAPTEGSFATLSAAERQAFLTSTFGAVAFKGGPDQAFLTEHDSLYAGYLAAVRSGSLPAAPTDLGEPPCEDGDGSLPLAGSPPPAIPVSAAQALESVVFTALALIDNPPPAGSAASAASSGSGSASRSGGLAVVASTLGTQLSGLLAGLGIGTGSLGPAVASIDRRSETAGLPTLSDTLLSAISTWSSR
jgi:hypothetical protein